MAMTNAERQALYRKRQRKAGKQRKDVWTDSMGLLAPIDEKTGWKRMSLKDLGKEIKKMFPEAQEWQKEVVYAELFEYTKLTREILKKALKLDNVTGNEL